MGPKPEDFGQSATWHCRVQSAGNDMRSYHQKQTVQGKTKGRKIFPRRLWMTLGVSGASQLPSRGRIWVLQPQVWVPGSQCAGAGRIAEDPGGGGHFPKLLHAVVTWNKENKEQRGTEVRGKPATIYCSTASQEQRVPSNIGLWHQGPLCCAFFCSCCCPEQGSASPWCHRSDYGD